MITALVFSALMAASAAAAPAGPASSGPITKDGVEITVLPQVGAAAGPAAVTEVGLDIEAKTAEAVTRLGFHSLRAVADVDCGKAANRFVSAEAFDQAGLAGAGRARTITGAWVQPTSDSYMAAVIARVCAPPPAVVAAARRPPAAAARPLPVVREMAAAPPPPVPTQAAPAPAAAPEAAPASAPAAAPTPPLVVKFSGGAPVAARPPVAAAAAKPAAAPPPTALAAASAPAAAPPPSAPLVVKFSGAAAGAAPTSVAAPPKRAGDRVAQVAASANIHDAEKVLRELKPLIAPPLTTTIEQAVVGAAHVYRADVVGFESAADAKAFCKSAASWSKTCWVRAKGDTAAPKPAEHLRAAKRAG